MPPFTSFRGTQAGIPLSFEVMSWMIKGHQIQLFVRKKGPLWKPNQRLECFHRCNSRNTWLRIIAALLGTIEMKTQKDFFFYYESAKYCLSYPIKKRSQPISQMVLGLAHGNIRQRASEMVCRDFVVYCVVFLKFSSLSRCFPNGAPLSACESMMPRHAGVVPQSNAAPYTVEPEASVFHPGKPVRGKFLCNAGDTPCLVKNTLHWHLLVLQLMPYLLRQI